MGNKVDPEAPQRPLVPEGKARICVAGYGSSPNYIRARNVAHELAKASPELYETWFYGPSRDKYFEWLPSFKAQVGEEWSSHMTAPLCWFEKPTGEGGATVIEVVGGRDKLCEWTVKTYPGSPAATLTTNFLLNPAEYFSTAPEPTVK